jgi:DNA-binding MarR family transcriptional regulator
MKATPTRIRSSSGSPSAGGPDELAFRALIRSFGLLKRVMEPYFAPFGISGAQWGVLRTLHRAEEQGELELRLTDLGQRLLIRPPSVTGAVDRLQRMGLVARAASPLDQRAKHVNLTPAGRALVLRVLVRHPAQIHSVLEGLDAKEHQQLSQLLDKLAAHMQALADGREAVADA